MKAGGWLLGVNHKIVSSTGLRMGRCCGNVLSCAMKDDSKWVRQGIKKGRAPG